MAKVDRDPYEHLPEEFKTAAESMNRDEIKKKVAEIALNHVELMKAKKDDGDLTEKRETYKEAGAIYREGAKQNKTKIEYLKTLLDSKGGSV